MEKHAPVKDDDYNFLKMMQLTDKNYNKIKNLYARINGRDNWQPHWIT